MEFISKYDISFIKFVNRKYGKKFKDFDSYGLYLYELNDFANTKYYYQLEEDIKEYSDYQTERKYNNGKSKGKNTQ